MKCLRCNAPMQDGGEIELQLGRHSFLFGDLDNLLSGSLSSQLYICPQCGKMELFNPNNSDTLSFSERLKRDNNLEDK